MNILKKILFIFFILYNQNFVKPESFLWTDTSNSLPFTDPSGWDLKAIPTILDDATINNGAIVFERVNNISVSAIFLEQSSLILENNRTIIYDHMELKKDSIFQCTNLITREININIYDASKIIVPTHSSIGTPYFNFYDNSEMVAICANASAECDASLIAFSSFYDDSLMKINGYIFGGNYYLFFSNNSKMNLTSSNVIIQEFRFYDNSEVYASNTFLSYGRIDMLDKSSMKLDNGSILSADKGTFSVIRNAEIISNSLINNNGDFYIMGDYLKVNNNSFLESNLGDLHLNSSVSTFENNFIQTLNGNIHIYQTVEGNNAQFKLFGGNLIIHQGSDSNLINSDILIVSGKLYISSDAKFILQNTAIRNENGTLSTSGIVTLKPGSSIKNENYFIIQSSILSTESSSNILLNNSGSITLSLNKTSENNNLKALDDNDDDSEIKIDINILNSGSIDVDDNQKIHFKQYTQTDNKSSLTFNNSTINSNDIIQIDNGNVNGNGTLGNSINQNSGSFGSKTQTFTVNINGNYTLNKNATILIKIDSIDEFSKMNISNIADLNGNIEIKVSKNLLYSDNNNVLDVINYSNLNSGFNSIKFKTYDPQNGKEDDENESDCLKSNTSSASFSVLVGGCSNKKSKLSGGAIAGIVIGCAVFVILVGSLLHYRNRLSLKFKQTKIGTKLSVRNKN